MSSRSPILLVLLTALTLALEMAPPANAGCGCDKPPPPPAAVRPRAASPGQEMVIVSSQLEVGRSYSVRFARKTGSAVSTGEAVLRRDLADGVMKPHVTVKVPPMSPGPASVAVRLVSGQKLLEDEFTVLQAPLAIEEFDGVTTVRCYSAAVGSDGTLYLPVNVTAISERMVFSGIAKGYPLLFSAADVAIYNQQGFLMQLLAPEADGALYSISDPGSPDSLELTYDRHEFVTYKDDHVHEGSLALDPTDPAWHVDGTRHVDHDHLVVAIAGSLEGGSALAPGVTPPFDLSIATSVVDAAAPSATRVIDWGGCGS